MSGRISITTTVPIVINAQFTTLGSDVLGSAGTTYLIRNFTGSPGEQYVVPGCAGQRSCRRGSRRHDRRHRRKLQQLVHPGTSAPMGTRLQASMISCQSFFTSSVMGWASSGQRPSAVESASWGFTAGVTTSPMSYDRRVVNGSLQELINTGLFPNPSVALANQLQSNNLFWNGAAGIAGNAGTRPRLYAPATWQPGSSYSHLDEVTYPAGNPNSLMTYAIGSAESIHSPGPITLGILTDIGWGFTSNLQLHARGDEHDHWCSRCGWRDGGRNGHARAAHGLRSATVPASSQLRAEPAEPAAGRSPTASPPTADRFARAR